MMYLVPTRKRKKSGNAALFSFSILWSFLFTGPLARHLHPYQCPFKCILVNCEILVFPRKPFQRLLSPSQGNLGPFHVNFISPFGCFNKDGHLVVFDFEIAPVERKMECDAILRI